MLLIILRPNIGHLSLSLSLVYGHINLTSVRLLQEARIHPEIVESHSLVLQICVLNMSCRVVDGLQVLCHIVRLPSPIAEWAPPFVQTFIQVGSLTILSRQCHYGW